MTVLLYNIFLHIASLLYLPKLAYDYFYKGKYRNSLRERLRPTAPHLQGRPIWFHAVSVGEVKALIPLVDILHREHPDIPLFLTTVTETGLAEAKRSLPQIDAYGYLPLDLPWIIKPFVKKVHPRLFIFSEGDLWLNLLKSLKAEGAQTAIVGAKISKRSLERHLKLKPYTQELFKQIDLICAQGREQFERLKSLPIETEIHNVGNPKLDIPFTKPDEETLKAFSREFSLPEGHRFITLASTHEKEEELILEALQPLLEKDSKLTLLVAPRHPERFESVRELLKGYPRAILIDKMGQLNRCFSLSKCAIVGGSFVSHVGGHDFFEPLRFGAYPIIGPHVFSQIDLLETLGEGVCQTTRSSLTERAEEILTSENTTWNEIRSSLLSRHGEISKSLYYELQSTGSLNV